MRSYAKEFKEEAVKLSKEIGTVKTADTLGISKNTLYTWISRDKKSRESGMCNGNSSISSEESIRLLKENAELKKANEILKAALGFFAKDQKM